jgi:hypothetical protein
VGLITAFLLWPIVGMVGMVLTISVVGILLVPVLVLGVAVALLFGLVVVSNWLGRRLYQTGYPSAVNSTPQLVVQVLLGMAVLLGSTLVPAAFVAPWVGMLMMALVYFAACVGLGSVILSRLGTLPPPRRVPVAASNAQGPAITAPLGQAPVFPSEQQPPSSM